MNMLELPPVSQPGFRAHGELEGRTTIVVRFTGSAEIPAKSALESLLLTLHAEAVRLGVKGVVVDFRNLEFMNSSCFKAFIAWIGSDRVLAVEQRYRIRLMSRPDLLWQRRSLHSLRCFADDLVTVET